MSVDRHYSSIEIANQVSQLIPAGVSRVFDPAAGEGALLLAVEQKLGPEVRILGADVDARAVTYLQGEHPTWLTGRADAWDAHSIAESPVWRSAQDGEPIYVVINPPFSFRGGQGQLAEVDGALVRLSPAVAFVLQLAVAIPALEGMVAVLPEGGLFNVRDRVAWEVIRRTFHIEVVRQLSAKAFPGVSANTAIVQFRRHASSSALPEELPAPRRLGVQCVCVDVIRGRYPIWSASASRTPQDTTPVVHSTDLRLPGIAARFGPSKLATHGTLLLFPRVGPTPRGRVQERRDASIVLSDCVFALRPRDEKLLDPFHAWLIAGMDSLESLYRGTGARHLTVASLLDFLRRGGWSPRHVGASSSPTTCSCQDDGSAAASEPIPQRDNGRSFA